MVRIKHRYLLLNVLFPESPSKTTSTTTTTFQPYTLQTHSPLPSYFTAASLIHLIRASVGDLFGDYGLGVIASGLKVIYFSPSTATAIVRCPRAAFRLVWAGLSFVKGLGAKAGNYGGRDQECVIRVVRVSGTVKKAEEEVVRRARRDIVRVRALEAASEDTGGLERMFGSGQDAAHNEDEGGIEDLSGDEDEISDDSG